MICDGTPVCFDDLAALAGGPLEELWIDDELPASAAIHLGKLPRLRDFHGKIMGADDRTVEQLCNCRDLRSVSLAGNGLTDAAVARLATLPRLQQLTLHGKLTDRSLAQIISMPQLTDVEVRGRFSLAAVDRLKELRPDLNGMLTTLLPNEYYVSQTRLELTMEPARSPSGSVFAPSQTSSRVELRSLIVVRVDYSSRERHAPAAKPLLADVYFPATLSDLAPLTVLRARVRSIHVAPPPEVLPASEPLVSTPPANPLETPIAGLTDFTNLEVLSLRDLPRDQLAQFKHLARLRALSIVDNSVTDEDLRLLQLPKTLESLHITSTHITHTGLELLRARYPNIKVAHEGTGLLTNNRWWLSQNLKLPSLETIATQTDLTGVSLKHVRGTVDCDPLAQLPDLTHLTVSGHAAHNQLWHLSQPLPALEKLILFEATDRELEQLQYCPSLRDLTLAQSCVSDIAFEHFRYTPNLQRLIVSKFNRYSSTPQYRPWITGSALYHLKTCPLLEFLDISGTQLRPRFLADLAELKHLKELDLSDTEIGDEGCQYLAQLPALETLKLIRVNVTDAGMERLATCPHLKVLDISRTAITDDGLECLSESHSLRSITVRSAQTTPKGQHSFAGRYPKIRLIVR